MAINIMYMKKIISIIVTCALCVCCFADFAHGFTYASASGKVTDYYNAPASSAVNAGGCIYVIQDVHKDSTAQTSIAKILTDLDKKHGIDKVYIEGLYKQPSFNFQSAALSDLMFETGAISGAEYFVLKNNYLNKVMPLEEKAPYLENIERLKLLTGIESSFGGAFEALNSGVKAAKYKHYSRNVKIADKKLDISLKPEIYAKNILKTISKINSVYGYDVLSLEDYPELSKFVTLSGIKLAKASSIEKDLAAFAAALKETLTYAQYKRVIDETENFSNYEALEKIFKARSNGKFKNLGAYIEYTVLSKNLNPFKLFDQARDFTREAKTLLALTETELEVIVLDDLQAYYKDFLLNTLTPYGYGYITDFGAQNFEKLALKYTNTDLSPFSKLYDSYETYNDVNIARNDIFTEKLLSSGGGNVAVVMGGFHSGEVCENLKKAGLNYELITPDISSNAQEAQTLFKQELLKVDVNALALPSLLGKAKAEQIEIIKNSLTLRAEKYGMEPAIEELNATLAAENSGVRFVEQDSNITITDDGVDIAQFEVNDKTYYSILDKGYASVAHKWEWIFAMPFASFLANHYAKYAKNFYQKIGDKLNKSPFLVSADFEKSLKVKGGVKVIDIVSSAAFLLSLFTGPAGIVMGLAVYIFSRGLIFAAYHIAHSKTTSKKTLAKFKKTLVFGAVQAALVSVPAVLGIFVFGFSGLAGGVIFASSMAAVTLFHKKLNIEAGKLALSVVSDKLNSSAVKTTQNAKESVKGKSNLGRMIIETMDKEGLDDKALDRGTLKLFAQLDDKNNGMSEALRRDLSFILYFLDEQSYINRFGEPKFKELDPQELYQKASLLLDVLESAFERTMRSYSNNNQFVFKKGMQQLLNFFSALSDFIDENGDYYLEELADLLAKMVKLRKNSLKSNVDLGISGLVLSDIIIDNLRYLDKNGLAEFFKVPRKQITSVLRYNKELTTSERKRVAKFIAETKNTEMALALIQTHYEDTKLMQSIINNPKISGFLRLHVYLMVTSNGGSVSDELMERLKKDAEKLVAESLRTNRIDGDEWGKSNLRDEYFRVYNAAIWLNLYDILADFGEIEDFEKKFRDEIKNLVHVRTVNKLDDGSHSAANSSLVYSREVFIDKGEFTSTVIHEAWHRALKKFIEFETKGERTDSSRILHEFFAELTASYLVKKHGWGGYVPKHKDKIFFDNVMDDNIRITTEHKGGFSLHYLLDAMLGNKKTFYEAALRTFAKYKDNENIDVYDFVTNLIEDYERNEGINGKRISRILKKGKAKNTVHSSPNNVEGIIYALSNHNGKYKKIADEINEFTNLKITTAKLYLISLEKPFTTVKPLFLTKYYEKKYGSAFEESGEITKENISMPAYDSRSMDEFIEKPDIKYTASMLSAA
jgi:hypothetical protein